MRRVIVLILLCACAVFAATVRLYLKDGTYQLVREYKVEGDRLRYYTVERGDWEEIPLELVDLKRTEGEVKVRQESTKEERPPWPLKRRLNARLEPKWPKYRSSRVRTSPKPAGRKPYRRPRRRW